ncbi:surfeit locus protein 6 [Colletotrichum fioriniae PJ7]|uniref:Surfeit locus protein 6 n=1 Tax=Colletotrichum fioriniae PJ7 TaxID=1445577 RepID=A0A010RAY3_9PEZI|nr:surfeit locus protein 6 [Colletotrichum fioriniae PJ7]
MAESTLQDRLREHSKAFDGLLSLIPAKMYYGEDNSEQWKRTKQTKAEAKAAKTAKLDPDSELNRNAKEVMDERAARNKRKLEAMQEEEDKEDEEPIPGVQRELPGQGLRMNKDYKKQKTADLPIDTIDDANPAEMSQNQLMRMAKKEAKLEKRATKKAKKAEKKAAKLEAAGGDAATDAADATDAEAPEVKESSKPADTKAAKSSAAAKKESSKKQQKKAESKDAKPVSNDHDRDADKDEDEEYETVDESDGETEPATKSKSKSADLNPLDLSGLAQQQKATESSGASTPASPTFDTTAGPSNTAASASTTTSTSSTVPPSEKPKHIKLPADTSALRARLAARIEALRAARKADGPDGKPIRTRQELIEARRFKQAQRKEHKKELRTKAKLEEEARREETLASNSPSVMSPRVGLGGDGDDGDDEPANFAFGRVAFDDGTKLSHDLSHALNTHKKRGPSDPKTALIKIQNQKKRLAALDKEKQADIAEKEQWLIARKRAEGERVRDDEQALKRAVKRKEQTKKKSEKAWKERSDGVAKSIREKQKKREDNLKKRKDDKLAHKLGRKSGKKVGGGGAKKTKARPGFEGSFGGGKKKK